MHLIGKQIAHYLIEAKIGEGGMGIVYKAEDTKLKRKVALKFLKPEALGNEQEKARFLREAQTAAALDHPNICTIFEVNEFEGQTYIAMAFIDGRNIDEKLEAGPLAIDEAINIATQAAEGLQAANEKGVVHRDIKSANIMVTTAKQQVKIMDFGLAKLAGQAKKLTLSGMTPGTVAYMSPEQARGEEVDHRSDIWSLGVVLYEMITGKLPFKGEYERAMLYSIMSEEPEPIRDCKTDIPIELENIINKMLQKNKEDRYQIVDEMLIDLQQLPLETPTISPKKPTPKIKAPRPARIEQSKTMRWMLLGLAIVLAFAISILIFYRKKEISKTANAIDVQISFTGKVELAFISPDGKSIAYVSRDSTRLKKVFVKDITGGQAHQVFEDQRIFDVRWSPSGTELLISSRSAIDSTIESFIIPRLGGTRQKIGSSPYISWSPSGSKIALLRQDNQNLSFTNKAGGDTNLYVLKGKLEWIQDFDWSPSGDLLLFLNRDQDASSIWTIRADGSQQAVLLTDSSAIYCPRWSMKGDAIYYLRHHGQTPDLMKIRVIPETGKAKGPAVVVQPRLKTERFSISSDNKSLLYIQSQRYANLWLITGAANKNKAKTAKPKQLTTGTSIVQYVSISPDGKNIAFSKIGIAQSNIFVMPIEGGLERQLTFLNSGNICPVWSPDGKEIAFASTQDMEPKVWIINSQGGLPRPYVNTKLHLPGGPLTWSPGKEIIYRRPPGNTFVFYHILNPRTGQERKLVRNDSIGWMSRPRYSPDNKKVVLVWNRKPTRGLWLISLEDSSQALLYPTKALEPIKWSLDGNWIYAYNSNQNFPEILKIPVRVGEIDTLIHLPFETVLSIDLTDDEDNIVCASYEILSDIWLMENFDPEIK